MEDNIKIEAGIPFENPKGTRGTGPKYPWRTMEVGDSFLFPPRLKTASSQAWMANKLYSPRKFAARSTPEGVRCWRLE